MVKNLSTLIQSIYHKEQYCEECCIISICSGLESLNVKRTRKLLIYYFCVTFTSEEALPFFFSFILKQKKQSELSIFLILESIQNIIG